MNWLAIFCAGAAYWVLGYVWYSLLFGKVWAAELVRHRGERAVPSGGEMGAKMIGTLICNLIAAGAMAYLFYRTGIGDMNHALRLGAVAGIGFAGTAITMAYIWESKPTKVWFIDAGFNFVGCLLLAMILALWQADTISGPITSVDAVNRKVMIARTDSQGNLPLTVSPGTDITLDGNVATFGQLAAGQNATAQYAVRYTVISMKKSGFLATRIDARTTAP